MLVEFSLMKKFTRWVKILYTLTMCFQKSFAFCLRYNLRNSSTSISSVGISFWSMTSSLRSAVFSNLLRSLFRELVGTSDSQFWAQERPRINWKDLTVWLWLGHRTAQLSCFGKSLCSRDNAVNPRLTVGAFRWQL